MSTAPSTSTRPRRLEVRASDTDPSINKGCLTMARPGATVAKRAPSFLPIGPTVGSVRHEPRTRTDARPLCASRATPPTPPRRRTGAPNRDTSSPPLRDDIRAAEQLAAARGHAKRERARARAGSRRPRACRGGRHSRQSEGSRATGSRRDVRPPASTSRGRRACRRSIEQPVAPMSTAPSTSTRPRRLEVRASDTDALHQQGLPDDGSPRSDRGEASPVLLTHRTGGRFGPPRTPDTNGRPAAVRQPGVSCRSQPGRTGPDRWFPSSGPSS